MGALVYAVLIVVTGLVWVARLALQLLVLCVTRPKVGLPLLAVVVATILILFNVYAGPTEKARWALILHLESPASATATAQAVADYMIVSPQELIDFSDTFIKGQSAYGAMSNAVYFNELNSFRRLHPEVNIIDGSFNALYLDTLFKHYNNAINDNPNIGDKFTTANYATFQAIMSLYMYYDLSAGLIPPSDKDTLNKDAYNQVSDLFNKRGIVGNYIVPHNFLTESIRVKLPDNVTRDTLYAQLASFSATTHQ